jgi:tRNA pseudouridine38-40 synthase
MRNIRMTIAYDGTNYVGWQVQPNGPSVQSTVERALTKLTGEKISVLSAGRTDSGVHALGQVASFHTSSSIPCEGFRKALRAHLPPDILIRDVADVPNDFHATFTAKYKRYRYVIHNSRTCNPFLRQFAWHYHLSLDTQAMHAAAQELVGRHDFRSFESHWPNKATSVRTVMEVTVKRQRHCPSYFGEEDVEPAADDAGDFVWIEIVADGFLYNMVRSIVGTLVPVGRGRWDASDMRRILTAMQRSEAGDTAPAHGLYMVEVTY